MNLIISLEYNTVWGESLVLCLGKREIPMVSDGFGRWTAKVSRVSSEALDSYGFKLVRRDGSLRHEWRHHSLNLAGVAASTSIVVRDRWQDEPEDAPFYSSAFTKGIFSRENLRSVPGSSQHDSPAQGGLPRVADAVPGCGATKGAAASLNSAKSAGTTLITVNVPVVSRDEVLCIVGDGEGMEDWKRVIPMDDSNFPQWKLAVSADEDFEYKFVIADRNALVTKDEASATKDEAPATKDGVLAIKEWESGENRVCIASDESFTVLSDISHRFGLRKWRGAGTAIPVFSLRSEDDFGVGEFLDLKKMVDWAAATGQCILQLLPINDTTMTGTWQDSYPYNANSTFALHPQFINLQAAGVKADAAFRALQEELNALPQVDYERVNREKIRLLREAYSKTFAKLSKTAAYKAFIAANRDWLEPYAAFCTLRDSFGTADFGKWKTYAKYSASKIEKYCTEHRDEVDFHCFVQFHLDRQLSEVRDYAHSKGVVLKGDLPIGISRTSTDAWQHPHLFNMDESAGAPPDAFAADGQNWGFPTYNWEEMAKDGFAWWKARLRKMSEYFDAFRIDHILGFFRIWEIPLKYSSGLLGHFRPALPYPAEELAFDGFDVASGAFVTAPSDDPTDVLFVEDPVMKGYWHPRIGAQNTASYRGLDPQRQRAFNRLHDDFFYRRHNDFWRESAMRKLPALLHATDMLACGEDLGMIPDCVASVMAELKILSLEIQRMPKSASVEFGDPEHYPYLCVCTTSTHDMNPIRAWWEEDREVSGRFFRLNFSGEAPYFCEPWLCRHIVRDHLDSPAMLTVLPLQDWLSIDGELRLPDPSAERINIPAVSRHYWRYRMHLSLETLLNQQNFNSEVATLIKDSGR